GCVPARSIAEVFPSGSRHQCMRRKAAHFQWEARKAGLGVLGTWESRGRRGCRGSSMPHEIRVLSTIGMRTVLEELAPAFERARRCTVTRSYESSVALMQRIAAGESG